MSPLLKIQFSLVFISSCFIFIPGILGVFETPEYVYLPPYFGCFHSTLYSEVPEEFQGTHFYFNSFGVLPTECIKFCLRNSTLEFEIAAIKGQFCICAHISDKQQLAYNLQKVPSRRCDIQCRKTIIGKGQVIVPNEHCGGNIPYSIYCAVSPNNQSSGPVSDSNNFCKSLWIGSVVETDVYLGDFTNDDFDDFKTQCVVCLNDSVVCPQEIFGQGRGQGQIMSIKPTEVIGFEYSPKNSPLNCINHCRQLLGRRIDFVAALGSSNKIGAINGVDTCYCIGSTGIDMDGFERVGSGNCSRRCPGDGSLNCANDRLGQGPEYFVLYGIFSKYGSSELTSTTEQMSATKEFIAETTDPTYETTTVETTLSTDETTQTTIQTTTAETTESTTESTSVETTQSTIETTTNETTQSTVETTTPETTESTNETTTVETTQSTNETTTVETTQSTNETTTVETTQSTNETTTVETTQSTNETTTVETTQSTNETTTVETTQSTNETWTTVSSAEPTISNPTTKDPSIEFTTRISERPPSPKTTTPPKDCPIKCSTYFYGKYWSVCAGEYAIKVCDNGGIIYWGCGSTGEFIGKPDTKNCTTPWIDKLKDEIFNETALGFDKADGFLKKIEDKCTNASKWDPDSVYFGHEISVVMNLGVEVMDKLDTKQVSITMFEDLASRMTTIVGIVLGYPEVWDQLSDGEKCYTGTELVNVIENSFFTLSTKVVEDENSENTVKGERVYYFEPDTSSDFPFKVETGVVLKSTSKGHSLRFPRTQGSTRESFIELPEDWADITSGFPDDDDEIEFVGIRIGILNATNLFNPGGDNDCPYGESSCSEAPAPPTKIVNSNMMSFSFGDKDNLTKTTFTGKGVQISFEHDVIAWGTAERPIRRKLHPGERQKGIQDSAACMFWDTDDLSWSSRGCKIVESSRTRTICECNHLTAFALLMDIHNYEGKEFWLELLTLILTPLSVICLFASLIIFIRFKEIQGPRTTITRNLCICLLIGMILVITVMDRNYIWLPDELCMVTAMLVHYIFLCVFAWMALEGLLLYRMVILVFDTRRQYMNYQRGGAYGVPLLIVGLTYLISAINDERAYGGDEFCWLEDNYKWGFMGPVAVITVVNLVILVVTLKKAYNLQQSPKANTGLKRKKSIVSWIRGTFGVTILLGGTWMFGFLMGIPNQTVSGIAACIFTILNASQGIFLFIFHCVLNKKVREHMRGHLPAWTSISFSTMLMRTNSSSSGLRLNKKSDALSFSDESNNSRRNTGNVEQIGRRELVPEF